MKHTAVASLLLLAAMASHAAPAPIYRCGPDGREYSQVPCAGGTVVEASDPRSAAQRAEALKVAASERKRVADLERDRRANEAAIKPAGASGFNARPAPVAPKAAAPSEKGKSKKRHTKVKRLPDTATAKPATERSKPKQ